MQQTSRLPRQAAPALSVQRRAPAAAARVRCLHGRAPVCREHNTAPAAISAQLQLPSLAQGFGRGLLGAAAAALLLAAPAGAELAADSPFLRIPVARDPELFKMQKTMAEAWTIVTEAYVDDSFNHTEWDRELAAGLTSVAEAKSREDARTSIPELLAKLGDPYTRWLPAKQYQDFRIGNDGQLQGVGMLIASDPQSGRLVVLAPIKGSPADQAGIQPGDELVNVNGSSTSGLDTDGVAQRLRGQEGSSVWVKVARRRQEIPGVAGLQSGVEYKQFRLQRAQVELNPVFATTMHMADHQWGYVRLVSFSQHAPADMHRAISQLKRDGVEGFILDLRNNPGGLVNAAMDIAGLWMDGPVPIFNVEDREGGDVLQTVGLAEPTSADTDLPLVVLVNKNSASASEILAGALHDNRRAEVLGESTYGKGKIQSVFELDDGSALFVTVAKYKTPAGSEIDQVGVQPDRACSPLGGAGGPLSMTGIPVGPGADEQVVEELASDDCVLSAEALLQKKLESPAHMPQSLFAANMHRSAPPLVAAHL